MNSNDFRRVKHRIGLNKFFTQVNPSLYYAESFMDKDLGLKTATREVPFRVSEKQKKGYSYIGDMFFKSRFDEVKNTIRLEDGSFLAIVPIGDYKPYLYDKKIFKLNGKEKISNSRVDGETLLYGNQVEEYMQVLNYYYGSSAYKGNKTLKKEAWYDEYIPILKRSKSMMLTTEYTTKKRFKYVRFFKFKDFMTMFLFLERIYNNCDFFESEVTRVVPSSKEYVIPSGTSFEMPLSEGLKLVCKLYEASEKAKIENRRKNREHYLKMKQLEEEEKNLVKKEPKQKKENNLCLEQNMILREKNVLQST